MYILAKLKQAVILFSQANDNSIQQLSTKNQPKPDFPNTLHKNQKQATTTTTTTQQLIKITDSSEITLSKRKKRPGPRKRGGKKKQTLPANVSQENCKSSTSTADKQSKLLHKKTSNEERTPSVINSSNRNS